MVLSQSCSVLAVGEISQRAAHAFQFMASDSKSDRNGMMKSLRTKSEVNRPPELALTLLQVLIGHAGKKKSRSLKNAMRADGSVAATSAQLKISTSLAEILDAIYH
jgi:hypothetical protein